MDIELDIDIQNNPSVEIHEQKIKFLDADLQINQNGMRKISDNESIYSQFHINPATIKMLEEIGKGASSKVYKAIHSKGQTKEIVAIKSICVLEKKLREQILSDLNTFFHTYSCPYLVTFHGCYYQAGSINQVLQYMNLGSIRRIIQVINENKIKIPEPVLSCIAKKLLKGLNYIHSQKNMIHRDIKPENILFNSQGDIKISDFGISKNMANNGIARTFVGTFVYMSPQRVKPPATYNYLSDIWSFGLVMYQLAIGDHPYKMLKDKPILHKILHLLEQKQPQLSQQYSFEFRDFLSHCICKDLQKRCSTDKLLTHQWITNNLDQNAFKIWLQQLIDQKII